MSAADKKGWYHAAWLVLEHVPADLLRRGVEAAMAKADHPSRIVPAIMAEVKGDWDWRRQARAKDAAVAADLAAQARDTRKAGSIEHSTAGESTREILARIWPTMSQHEPGLQSSALHLDPDRPCRRPSREDYLRMGIGEEHVGADASGTGRK